MVFLWFLSAFKYASILWLAPESQRWFVSQCTLLVHGEISQKVGTDIHGSHWVYPKGVSDTLTLTVTPPAGWQEQLLPNLDNFDKKWHYEIKTDFWKLFRTNMSIMKSKYTICENDNECWNLISW